MSSLESQQHRMEARIGGIRLNFTISTMAEQRRKSSRLRPGCAEEELIRDAVARSRPPHQHPPWTDSGEEEGRALDAARGHPDAAAQRQDARRHKGKTKHTKREEEPTATIYKVASSTSPITSPTNAAGGEDPGSARERDLTRDSQM